MDERVAGLFLIIVTASIVAAFLVTTILVPSPEVLIADTLENSGATLGEEGLYDKKFDASLRISTMFIRVASLIATLLTLKALFVRLKSLVG